MKELDEHIAEAEAKAWESLARYKFQMFGYWAAIWVHLNRISEQNRPNPWSGLLAAARNRQGEQAGQIRLEDAES